MSNHLNQENKEAVWDFWQKLNHVGVDNVPETVRAAVQADVDWNVSAPIDQVIGAEDAISGFWAPLFQAFPDLKHEPYVFMGGIDEGSALYATEGGEEWVSGCGYLTGTFANDWLGIPATGTQDKYLVRRFLRHARGEDRRSLSSARYSGGDAAGGLSGAAAGAGRGGRDDTRARRQRRHCC